MQSTPTARELGSLAGQPTAISGMGADAPTITNAQGGRQSALPYRFDLIDPRALFDIAQILAAGAEKYGAENWRQIPINDNLNHALAHINAFLAGDRQDDHLGHAACRAIFALALQLTPPPSPPTRPANLFEALFPPTASASAEAVAPPDCQSDCHRNVAIASNRASAPDRLPRWAFACGELP